ncbi:hypothetical protein C8R44DRAFT_752968 [Mycena epipterygia]|nr:hypothetical protein C8R44DRAFT_752968 [Mycena epipterygia]
MCFLKLKVPSWNQFGLKFKLVRSSGHARCRAQRYIEGGVKIKKRGRNNKDGVYISEIRGHKSERSNGGISDKASKSTSSVPKFGNLQQDQFRVLEQLNLMQLWAQFSLGQYVDQFALGQRTGVYENTTTSYLRLKHRLWHCYPRGGELRRGCSAARRHLLTCVLVSVASIHLVLEAIARAGIHLLYITVQILEHGNLPPSSAAGSEDAVEDFEDKDDIMSAEHSDIMDYTSITYAFTDYFDCPRSLPFLAVRDRINQPSKWPSSPPPDRVKQRENGRSPSFIEQNASSVDFFWGVFEP